MVEVRDLPDSADAWQLEEFQVCFRAGFTQRCKNPQFKRDLRVSFWRVFHAVVERTWHNEDSQGPILALDSR